ncbi:Formylglycine-generating enzyme, required for sulfatase activity, contains SUMF1/FGE domain [Paenibacillus sp. UNCCL117]|uniref:formylglycine-generating enzyme family protein n=1 Tax=unclassified Paenibacillus TaxID=185978 RepID=UPI0008880E27|nr:MULTISPECIES: SUMF1/EgtB/PvdO family nonheme iron enzyme [unclassified Paenibacillus]SDC13640.1 Formylglycine-generating enzyme, required for sulfatase activity, contains SUMF1/FGE domain [Paenibacillus sp. cl123]SFW17119.1 Formylglycine-generating enzyme, required for sulfatase activity, contains SUMF1/FGE domain [Paenibacillus sp. UNCCL117]
MSDRGNHPADYPMMAIPAGSIDLRDDRIQAQWTVQLDSFLLAPVPVTEALYSSILQKKADAAKESQAPVVDVSWQDAISFCNLFSRQSGLKECYSVSEDGEQVVCDWEADGYRLPTEAEWQHACQAGTKGYRYGELEEIAWYQGNSEGKVHKAGAKLPNAWGLYDMLGNVWEWCWDVYDARVYGSYRIFRGGSWAEEARGCGATCRRRSHPTFRIDDLGFRVARSLSGGASSDM